MHSIQFHPILYTVCSTSLFQLCQSERSWMSSKWEVTAPDSGKYTCVILITHKPVCRSNRNITQQEMFCTISLYRTWRDIPAITWSYPRRFDTYLPYKGVIRPLLWVVGVCAYCLWFDFLMLLHISHMAVIQTSHIAGWGSISIWLTKRHIDTPHLPTWISVASNKIPCSTGASENICVERLKPQHPPCAKMWWININAQVKKHFV